MGARAPGAKLERGSLHEVALPPCAVVTALGECVGYDGPPSLELLFRRVQAALEPGGLLVFDAAAPGREPELERRARHEGDGWTMQLDVREDRAARTLTRRIALVRDGRSSEELHTLRLYEPDDVVDWLETAGFDATRHPSYGAARALSGMQVYVATRRQR